MQLSMQKRAVISCSKWPLNEALIDVWMSHWPSAASDFAFLLVVVDRSSNLRSGPHFGSRIDLGKSLLETLRMRIGQMR